MCPHKANSATVSHPPAAGGTTSLPHMLCRYTPGNGLPLHALTGTFRGQLPPSCSLEHETHHLHAFIGSADLTLHHEQPHSCWLQCSNKLPHCTLPLALFGKQLPCHSTHPEPWSAHTVLAGDHPTGGGQGNYFRHKAGLPHPGK